MNPEEITKLLLKVPNRKYSDWFGDGTMREDVRETINAVGKLPLGVYPEEVGGSTVLVEFDDCFVVAGYDGNEYVVSFSFEKKEAVR